MKVSVENAGGCRRVVQVDAPADAIAEEYSNVLEAYRKAARIQGFRKGKAPLDVVEKRYSKEIADDTSDRVIPGLYRKAIEQESIDPVASVDVEDVRLSRNEGITFKVTLDVAPEFRLPRYKKISLKREKVEIGEKDVDDALNRLRMSPDQVIDVDSRTA